jgi:hypothetical protein
LKLSRCFSAAFVFKGNSYANRNKTPRPETIKKIEFSLQNLGKELSQVHFCQ